MFIVLKTRYQIYLDFILRLGVKHKIQSKIVGKIKHVYGKGTQLYFLCKIAYLFTSITTCFDAEK